MGSVEEAGWIAAVVGLVGGAIGLVLDLALLAIALGPVRRHRPELAGLFGIAAVIAAITTLASPFVYVASSYLSIASAGDAAATVRTSALAGMVVTLLRAVSFSLVLAGIARLATPARRDPREPD